MKPSMTFIVLFFQTILASAHASNLMLPQVSAPPFFEGWYTKIDTNNRSIIIILGTKFKYNNGSIRKLGMLSLITREGDEPAKQFNVFPENVSIGNKNSKYLWKTSNDSIFFSDSFIKISHPGLPKIEAQLSLHQPWQKGSPFGPEGLMVHNPLLYSHWFVFSMDSKVKLAMTQGGQKIDEYGRAHVEKNWGNGFPKAWMWSQGRDLNNSLSFAFAGGKAPSHIGVPLNVWALNVKHLGKDHVFSPVISNINAKVTTDCKSFFHFKAGNLKEYVSLRLESKPQEFLPIYGVISKDWEQVAKESFHSLATIKLYRGRRKLISTTIPYAAMEFGGDCQVSM